MCLGHTADEQAAKVSKAWYAFLSKSGKKGLTKAGIKSSTDDVAQFFVDALGMNKQQAKKYMNKHGITGDTLTRAAMRAGYRNLDATAKLAPGFMKLIMADAKLSKYLAQLTKFSKATNLDVIDAVELIMTYNIVKDYYLRRGSDKSEATKQAVAAVIAHGIGKTISTQALDRFVYKMSRAETGYFKGLGKAAIERLSGIAFFNLGDLETYIDNTKEAVAGKLEGASDALRKNRGGLIDVTSTPVSMNRGGLIAM